MLDVVTTAVQAKITLVRTYHRSVIRINSLSDRARDIDLYSRCVSINGWFRMQKKGNLYIYVSQDLCLRIAQRTLLFTLNEWKIQQNSAKVTVSLGI